MTDDIVRTAWFSQAPGYERQFRFTLGRTWDRDSGRACFVMLNPSTADEQQDDPTIRRVMRFARDWGYGGVDIVNLSPVVSSNPDDILKRWPPSIAYRTNRAEIVRQANAAEIVVLAWGAHKVADLPSMSHDLRLPWDLAHCLGVNANGSPKHPLYVRADTQPQPWGEALDAWRERNRFTQHSR